MIFIEPVGSTKPKFPNSDIVQISSEGMMEITLLCPAQGFPVPSFRCVFLFFLLSFASGAIPS